ncbi:MAG: class I SAM-dependent methyltransferase [Coxiellaceae bacterium]|nr:MAG: class I SAM-dependent methyltransferase [Coxiellaceae bacterium]
MQDKTSHWDSQKYSENSTMQYAQSMAMIEQYPFQGDEAILDIGCGDGKITYQIALRVPKGKVLGVDNSEDMIHFAQKHFLPNLTYLFN